MPSAPEGAAWPAPPSAAAGLSFDGADRATPRRCSPLSVWRLLGLSLVVRSLANGALHGLLHSCRAMRRSFLARASSRILPSHTVQRR